MGSKNRGPKRSGSKRTISNVKRSNQKRNKLIKKGKLKPKSTSTYHAVHQKPGTKKKPRESRPVLDHESDEDERLSQASGDAQMELEDAIRLVGRKHRPLEELEADYLTSSQGHKRAKTDNKTLLPLKTKSGLVFQEGAAKQDSGDDDDDDAAESDASALDEGIEMSLDECDETEPEQASSEPKSVLQLMSERERLLESFKIQVGSMASNFLEHPEERLYVLEKLLQHLKEGPALIRNAAFKLVSATLTEIFKDIIPNYTIAHHNTADKMKKDTLRLHGFESAILKHCKAYLMLLEARLKSGHKSETVAANPIQFHILRCLNALLISHSHFNYAPNIVQLLTPLLDHRDPNIRRQIEQSFETVLQGDKKGEISLCVVKHVKKMVSKKSYKVHTNCLSVLSSLRLNYLKDLKAEKEREIEEARDKKKQKAKHYKMQQQQSKKEKKRKKQMEKVEREMLEAKGEEGKRVREKFFLECMKITFAMLFRVIKSSEEFKPKLLAPCLRAVSKFVHLINIDFFHDLLRELSAHVQRPNTSLENRLLCIQTAFDILTGPGDCITFDPSKLIQELMRIMLQTDLNECPDSVRIICKVVVDVIVKRKRQVSRELVQVMIKVLNLLALQVEVDHVSEVQETLGKIRAAHLRTYEAALSTEEEAPPTKCAMLLGPEVANLGTILWEQNLLAKCPQQNKIK